MRIWSRLCLLILFFNFLIFFSGYFNKPVKAQSSSNLNWPEISSQTKPWTRWWWMGSIVNKKDLTIEMEKYAKAGLGGLEITPIYGVKGYEDKFIDYLTPQWMEMLVHTLEEADRLGIGIDMATGNGWPFGGLWVQNDTACKNMTYRKYSLKEGEKLKETVAMIQRPMVRAIGGRIDISQLKEPLSDNDNLQEMALEQVRFEKPMQFNSLMAYSDEGQILDLSEKVDVNGILDWTAPSGNWTLYAIFQGWHGKMVERAGPGGEGNVIDHFSSKALNDYLAKFDKAFSEYHGHLAHESTGKIPVLQSIRAFFNDSYEVDDASGESDWTDDFFNEFERLRGYDLRKHLPALFGEDTAEKNGRVICDYRETISDLLLEEFTVAWRKWAEKNGATIRNQAHGSPANLLDLYAASGIPETEGSDLLGYKLASSAAHVTGNKLASSEAATWLDEHFFSSLGDVKPVLDKFFLGGINHICYHGTTYSPQSEEWPGWMFYASVHFGTTNTFWKDFHALNTYVTRCQSFLQAGKPDNDILVYFPIYDLWSQLGRSRLVHFSATAPRTIAGIGQKLLQGGYSFDFVSDRQINDVEFSDGSLQTGDISYRAIIVPRCNLIPLETFQKLLGLAKSGAKIIFENNLPSDVPGLNNLEQKRIEFKKAVSEIDFTNQQNMKVAQYGNGEILLGSNVEQILSIAKLERELMVEKGLGFVRRKMEGSTIYFIVNNSRDVIDGWIPVKSKFKAALIFEPMQSQIGKAAIRTSEENSNDVYVQLSPGESCILKTFDKEIDTPLYKYKRIIGEPIEITGTWTVEFVEGGPELPQIVKTEKLGSWTSYEGDSYKKFSGAASYKTSFKKPENDADGWFLDLGRVSESAEVLFNGKNLGTYIGPLFQVYIPRDIMRAENNLEVIVSNLMLNRIIDLDKSQVNWKKFYNTNFPSKINQTRGAGGQFDASRLSPVDSGLLGPVTTKTVEYLKF
ncbi:MAG: hypothetical protein JXA96_11840 [Sedimentisphaerales bacterium]|nr:hypothetical protein [Sedimentisphaerales bacterium]